VLIFKVLYRERLTQAGAVKGLFERFDAALRAGGYLAMAGQIVDATVVEARRPRLTEDERRRSRQARPEAWFKAKRAQMDTDGRWTLKRGRRLAEGRSSRRTRTSSRSRCSSTRTTSASTSRRVRAALCACLPRMPWPAQPQVKSPPSDQDSATLSPLHPPRNPVHRGVHPIRGIRTSKNRSRPGIG
jgi:hypothetical protein